MALGIAKAKMHPHSATLKLKSKKCKKIAPNGLKSA